MGSVDIVLPSRDSAQIAILSDDTAKINNFFRSLQVFCIFFFRKYGRGEAQRNPCRPEFANSGGVNVSICNARSMRRKR